MLHNPGVFAILVLLDLGLLAALWLLWLRILSMEAEMQALADQQLAEKHEQETQERQYQNDIVNLRQSLVARDQEVDQLRSANSRLALENADYVRSANDYERAVAALSGEKAELQSSLNETEAQLRQRREEFYQTFRKEDLLSWLDQQRYANYANTDAVNTQLIYPFLRRLGYPDNALVQNHDFSIDVEGVAHDARADWIALDPSGAPPPRTLVVVHTLDAHAAIDETQIDRARQHAYSLEAGRFVLTNGRQMTVCTRGIAEDKRRLDIAVEDLLHHWYEIESELKPDAARNE